MSIILSDNFNAGILTPPWHQENPFPNTGQFGCSFTKCFSCRTSQISKDFGAVTYNEGTVRFSTAWLNLNNPTTDPVRTIFFTVVDFTNNSNPFQLAFAFVHDTALGHLRALEVRVSSVASVSFFYSADNVIPLDGTWIGFEAGWQIVGGSVHLEAYVNGALILSLDSAKPWIADQWTKIALITYQVPGGILPTTQLTAIDNFELENTFNITGLHACTAPQLYANICSSPPTTLVTGLAIDCVLTRITITGVNFLAGATIALIGPTGLPVPFTLVSLTSTTIVLQLTPPFVNGLYTVTVQNSGGIVSTPFSQTLACLGNPACVVVFPAGTVPEI